MEINETETTVINSRCWHLKRWKHLLLGICKKRILFSVRKCDLVSITSLLCGFSVDVGITRCRNYLS